MPKIVLILIGLTVSFLSGAEKIKVLTTFSPIYCFTKNVAGNLAEVNNLLPENVGPHDYMMRPQDAKKISAADVIVFNGLGLEEFLEQALKINGKALRIDTSAKIKILRSSETLNHQAEEHHHAGEEDHAHHHHGLENPHIWLDPLLAVQQVKAIAQGLAKADPKYASAYQKNAENYILRLKKLHESYTQVLKPLKNRKMIAFHDAFPYLAKRYDIQEVGVFEAFPGKQPSPKYLANLIDLIRRGKISVLFSEPQYSPQLLKQVAQDTGVKTAELDTMEVGTHTKTFYEEVALKNLKILTEAFR